MDPVLIQFYTTTRDAWEIMLEDIRAATHSVDIEQYIFVPDSIGQRFLGILKQKNKEGVRIRIVCDAVGSYTLYRSPIPDQLRTEGIGIKFFNPISPWRIKNFTSYFFRNHRKVMVIDGRIAHVGGVGIQEHMAEWRDTHMRIVGPTVAEIAQSFETVWRNVWKGFLLRFKRPEYIVKKFTLLNNSPWPQQRHVYRALIAAIRNARRYVYLTTPYFIPDSRLFRVLKIAAKKGIDVRLIVPQIADHLFVNHARESYFTPALKSGIKIYNYQDVMMHAKTAVVDDQWATAGSFNLDSLSLFYNTEVNIASTDVHFIAAIKHQFVDDTSRCREIAYREWIQRPLRKKILEFLTWPFHGIM